MKTYTFIWIRLSLIFTLGITAATSLAQKDTIIKRVPFDTSSSLLNMDAAYNRPFLTFKKVPIAIGGYLETNSMYKSEDGVTEGLSFQARRFTLFMSASIKSRLKFLAELEFEDGTKEISIEFAAMDVAVHPLFNLRGGIVMNPIGAFNQNHDGPKWEFIERPDVATNLLAATWSNAGFGIFGKLNAGNWIFGYEAYLTNGFDDQIIDNESNKTFLPATKTNKERFEENNSGSPLITGKIAIKNRKIGEVGISYMGGVFNKFEDDGITLDIKRRLDVIAFDLNTRIPVIQTTIVGEFAYTFIDVPATYSQQYGNRQWGIFIDIIQPVIRKPLFGWEKAVLNIAGRFDFVDWNVGGFKNSGESIGEEMIAVTPSVSFRPSPQTVFRLNYRYQWQKDILSNPAAQTASWMFGFSTYF
jgi:hypothetical protein